LNVWARSNAAPWETHIRRRNRKRSDDAVAVLRSLAAAMDMDEAFCACMRIAIAAGLESVPISVITTPGTKKPKYVLAEPPWPLASSLVNMDF
jgi:hypothetical protein